MTDGQPANTTDILGTIVRSAIERPEIASAAIFVLPPGATILELGAAAGIEGPALDGLAAAVRNPAHPIARSLADSIPSFNVPPVARGGPALRSHVPVLAQGGRRRTAIGVLAVAHETPLDAPTQRFLVELADQAAGAIDPSAAGPGPLPAA